MGTERVISWLDIFHGICISSSPNRKHRFDGPWGHLMDSSSNFQGQHGAAIDSKQVKVGIYHNISQNLQGKACCKFALHPILGYDSQNTSEGLDDLTAAIDQLVIATIRSFHSNRNINECFPSHRGYPSYHPFLGGIFHHWITSLGYLG